eukprot:m.59331 g.59331  ORF g.59331 m.59331 type:complete len:84 (+) comp11766_c0_seq2:2272-2523(+)
MNSSNSHIPSPSRKSHASMPNEHISQPQAINYLHAIQFHPTSAYNGSLHPARLVALTPMLLCQHYLHDFGMLGSCRPSSPSWD